MHTPWVVTILRFLIVHSKPSRWQRSMHVLSTNLRAPHGRREQLASSLTLSLINPRPEAEACLLDALGRWWLRRLGAETWGVRSQPASISGYMVLVPHDDKLRSRSFHVDPTNVRLVSFTLGEEVPYSALNRDSSDGLKCGPSPTADVVAITITALIRPR